MDAWRYLNPNTIQFTWFNSNCKSRIDHWFIANELLSYDISADISATPWTDHSLIYLQLKPQNKKEEATKYWKFNSNLLNNPYYCENIKSLLSNVMELEELDSPVRKWEFFKYKVKQFFISFGKKNYKGTERKGT